MVHEELLRKLSRLQWLFHRHHVQNHAAHGPFSDPTRGQGRVLALLQMQPDISARDMTYVLGIRQQSLNELLGKLEKGGYITRTPSETDKRVMVIRLTEEGKAARHENYDVSDIFGCLNEDEKESFGEYLDRVAKELEKQCGNERDGELDDWMSGARERMGREQFERLMKKFEGGKGRHFGDKHRPGGPWRPHGPRGFGGFPPPEDEDGRHE